MKEGNAPKATSLTNSNASGTWLRRTEENVRLRKMLFSAFAAFGVFGGISALFVGIVFVVLHSMMAGDRIFDTLGTGLLISAIPMILIGSIFIDKIQGTRR